MRPFKPNSTTKVSQTYEFTYNSFGQMTNISVGGSALATYTYESYNGNLTNLAYGNGDSVTYTYDNLDRVVSETYTVNIGIKAGLAEAGKGFSYYAKSAGSYYSSFVKEIKELYEIQ